MEKNLKKNRFKYTYVTESLFCTPETSNIVNQWSFDYKIKGKDKWIYIYVCVSNEWIQLPCEGWDQLCWRFASLKHGRWRSWCSFIQSASRMGLSFLQTDENETKQNKMLKSVLAKRKERAKSKERKPAKAAVTFWSVWERSLWERGWPLESGFPLFLRVAGFDTW